MRPGRLGYDGRVPTPTSHDAAVDRALGVRLATGAAAAALVSLPFLVLLFLVRSQWAPLRRLDSGVADRLNETAQDRPWLVDALEVGEVLTSPWLLRVVVVAVAVWLWRNGARRLAAWAVTTLVVGGLLGALLKVLVARGRPGFDDPVAFSNGYSFPSGHALNSLLAAGILLLVFLPVCTPAGRVLAYAGAATLVLFTGYDRLGLGVHYVSDVVAGWVVALATLAGTAGAFDVWRRDRGLVTSPLREGLAPESTRSATE